VVILSHATIDSRLPSYELDCSLAKEASDVRKDEVRAAFQVRGLPVAREGPAAVESIEILGLRIDAAYILGAAVGGLLWDAEKELLKRGLEALRSVWQMSGSVTIDTDANPRERPPTVYLVPGSEHADQALAAIDADYEIAPVSVRVWLPTIGWVDSADPDRIRDDAAALAKDHGRT
jgi:hypothetical protein